VNVSETALTSLPLKPLLTSLSHNYKLPVTVAGEQYATINGRDP